VCTKNTVLFDRLWPTQKEIGTMQCDDDHFIREKMKKMKLCVFLRRYEFCDDYSRF